MTTIAREIWIDAPKNEVWAALADFGNIYRFNPAVPVSYLTGDKTSGPGAERHCDLNMQGASLDERIVGWQEGEKMVIEIYGGEKLPPWKKATAHFSVRELKGGTLARAEFEYGMKFGPIGALMDRFMIRPQFGKAFGGILAGLKHYLETGEEVSGAKGLPFDQVIAVPA